MSGTVSSPRGEGAVTVMRSVRGPRAQQEEGEGRGLRWRLSGNPANLDLLSVHLWPKRVALGNERTFFFLIAVPSLNDSLEALARGILVHTLPNTRT